MLVKVGSQARDPGDLVDALLECHARIRSFLALAIRSGSERDAPSAEVIDACARIERYFVEALPLHVEDEEQSVRPRLQGHGAELDRALRTMHTQHAEHEPLIRDLRSACEAVRQRPSDVDRREHLRVAATELERVYAEHLTLEETLLFPAVRQLPPLVQDEILDELRRRRARQPGRRIGSS